MRTIHSCSSILFACALAVSGGAPLRGQDAKPPAAAAVARAPDAAAPDSRRRQIDEECANLLQMANDLKIAVDKTTKDELSLAVVRKAGEIEQLARRVRDEMKPAAGRN